MLVLEFFFYNFIRRYLIFNPFKKFPIISTPLASIGMYNSWKWLKYQKFIIIGLLKA